MATVPARLSLSVKDVRGGRGTFLVHALVSDAQTIAQANTAIGALATVLAGVSECGIIRGHFSTDVEGIGTDPADDSDLVSGAVFTFDNAADSTSYGQFVPSFKDTLVLPGGAIDISAGANATFVAAMIGAVMGGHYANGHYVANEAGLAAFLSSRKRLRR